MSAGNVAWRFSAIRQRAHGTTSRARRNDVDQIADSGLWAWIGTHKLILAVAFVLVVFLLGYLAG